jgi:quinol monooxygenase YgiN
MIYKIKQYSVDSGNIEVTTKSIAELLDGIRRNEPHTRYEVYRLKETDSFIHFMSFPDEHAEQVHRTAPYTQQFTGFIEPLCTDKPRSADLDKIEGMTGGEYE